MKIRTLIFMSIVVVIFAGCSSNSNQDHDVIEIESKFTGTWEGDGNGYDYTVYINSEGYSITKTSISDTDEDTAKKVMTAITDRSRIRKDDLGHPDECEVAFKYWKIFGTEEEIATVREECEKGLRGCAQCKRELGAKINARMADIREKRRYYEEHPEIVDKIIREGSEKARIEARKVLNEVRNIVNMY